MADLEHVRNGNGAIERFGASTKITDALIANFEERGRQAAQLLLATLSETAYTPTIGGDRFEVEVSNRFGLTTSSNRDGEQGEAPDTVDEAREALAEFLAAKPPGAKKIGLETYKTRYSDILSNLQTDRKTPENQRGAYEEVFVETSRARGVQLRA